MKIAIGLGTSRCYVAKIGKNGTPQLLPDQSDLQHSFTPSTICLTEGVALVGRLADKLLSAYPELPHTRDWIVRLGSDAPVLEDLHGQSWWPEGLAALMLSKLKNDAEAHSPHELDGAIIAVPAHFREHQRDALVAAAGLAGLPILGMVDEPLAAVSVFYNRSLESPQLIVVCDFGAESLKLSVVKPTEASLLLVSHTSIPELGGAVLDVDIKRLMVERAQLVTEHSLEHDPVALLHFEQKAEETKLRLATTEHIREVLTLGSEILEMEIGREDLASLFLNYAEGVKNAITTYLSNITSLNSAIGMVVCCGGGCSNPTVQSVVRSLFSMCPHIFLSYAGPTATLGAAKQGMQAPGTANMRVPSRENFSVGLLIRDHTQHRNTIDVLFEKDSQPPTFARRLYYRSRFTQDYLLFELLRFSHSEEDSVTLDLHRIGPLPPQSEKDPIETTWEYAADGTIKYEYLHRAFGTISGTIRTAVSPYALRLRDQRELLKLLPVNIV